MADDNATSLESLVDGLAAGRLEQLGDESSDKEIKDILKDMSDLELGNLVGIAQITGGWVCEDANIENGALDGTCRLYGAAITEYKNRQDTSPKR